MLTSGLRRFEGLQCIDSMLVLTHLVAVLSIKLKTLYTVSLSLSGMVPDLVGL